MSDIQDLLQSWISEDSSTSSTFNYYLINFKEYKHLVPGAYQYNGQQNKFTPLFGNIALDGMRYALNHSDIYDNDTIIIISSNLEQRSAYEGNVAYKQALIEVGARLQKAKEFAAQLQGSMQVFNTFDENFLVKKLKLERSKNFLLSIFIYKEEGCDPVKTINSFESTANLLQKSLLLDERLSENLEISYYKLGSSVVPRVFAFAPYTTEPTTNSLQTKLSHKSSYGCGAGQTLAEAKVKALAEAFERLTATNISWDVVSSSLELQGDQIDPSYIHTIPRNYKNADLTEFSSDKIIEWKKGYKQCDNSPCWVPIDLIYYPLDRNRLGRPPVFRTNSSGMAAHTDKNQAILSGLLELIERDALMVTWYAKREVNQIELEEIPLEIKDRYETLSQKGVNITFFDLTLDTVPVILCVVSSEKHKPYFTTGASADFNSLTAIAKAFNEAEFGFYSWRNVKSPILKPHEVFSTRHHAQFYFNKENWHELQWLVDANRIKYAPSKIELTTKDLFQRTNPIVVEMHDPTTGIPLWVVRVISNELLPITFGYGTEHYQHSRLKEFGLEWKRAYPSLPHFIA